MTWNKNPNHRGAPFGHPNNNYGRNNFNKPYIGRKEYTVSNIEKVNDDEIKHRNEEKPDNTDNNATTDRTDDETWYYEDGHANIEDGYQNEGRGWYEEEENAEYFLE